MIPGGLSESRSATEEVQEIVDQVKPQLEEKTNEKYEKFEATEYKTQVVAGVNYFIKNPVEEDGVTAQTLVCSHGCLFCQVYVGGDCFIHLKVFKSLSGENNFELVAYQTNKTEKDELTYF